ncbi:hypothetical protein M441DRAFT_211471 [Trichoderma asperellum CBS 433.97]|uniref:Uncharacterized protein n=1 Tax=Trichoderma asperellum (strain ATCC 204424 / CBS 433.97 / NBRC 101777) TaxID=1042311 RepID=A0A2T3ZN59_TRIA4|nr:hypothetical protein M441DRAFT_211471 [Trichoderma asperellum CBS 433.97]PTB46239.1 hypothetical protein M441DRAFT_211471 [Trichoderma asperellum CBS 433.97]
MKVYISQAAATVKCLPAYLIEWQYNTYALLTIHGYLIAHCHGRSTSYRAPGTAWPKTWENKGHVQWRADLLPLQERKQASWFALLMRSFERWPWPFGAQYGAMLYLQKSQQGLASLASGMVRGPLHLGHSKRWMKLARHASPPRHPLRNPLDGHPFWTQFPGVSNGRERGERSQRAHGRC